MSRHSVERPEQLTAAYAVATVHRGVSVVDVVVTRDPAKLLPGVDNRAMTMRKGDRTA